MAKENHTVQDLEVVENHLATSLRGIREIKNAMAAHDAGKIALNFGTVQYYSEWVADWCIRTAPQADRILERQEKREADKRAKAKVKEVQVRKKKTTKKS